MRHIYKYMPEVSNCLYDHPIDDVAQCLRWFINPQRFKCIRVIPHYWVYDTHCIEVVVDYNFYKSPPNVVFEIPNVYMRYQVELSVFTNPGEADIHRYGSKAVADYMKSINGEGIQL